MERIEIVAKIYATTFKQMGGVAMGDNFKPRCKLVGEDGNIFFILSRVSLVLKESGKEDEAKEVRDRVMASGSYDEALNIIMEYVDVE